jgi:aryl-alcohol dehydrogenase
MSIEQLSVRELRTDEVLVRVSATRICHSDVAERDGVFPLPRPIVLIWRGQC